MNLDKQEMEDYYNSTVEKLLEATAAMSLAVENKKPTSPMATSTSSVKPTHVNRISNKQPTLSESSLEDSQNKPPRDRRKSYSQGQPTFTYSSLDSKSSNNVNQQQSSNDIGNISKSIQDGNKTISTQISNPKSADRRYSIASTHIAIANHISSSNQGIVVSQTE
jgi:hypothetical protein